MRRFHYASFCYVLFCTLALAACGGDDYVPGEISGSGEAGDEADSGEDEVPINWVPARGIEILEIEANQGTRVPVTDADGAWIGPDERNMRLLSDRDTLIRVHWTVADDWEPHDVTARLTLHLDGASDPMVHEQRLTVEGDSTRTALDRTFYFGLVAENGETSEGARIEVELFEPDVASDPALPEANPAPASGPELIGFETTPMELKVMLVPIHYTGNGEDRLPNLELANVEKLVDALYEENPVQTVSYQVRGPIGYGQPMNNLASLLPLMAGVKQSDAADPNIYYHAFIDIGCPVVGCGSSGVAGIAQIASDSKNASSNRVAATVFFLDGQGTIKSTIQTFVHEVGHNQGLAHVACPGVDAAGPDPTYPYANGKIGQWGFGIRSFTLHNPTASHDYMTYCGNTWSSDWTFLKTYNRIRTLTSWDYEGASADDSDPWTIGQELLVGALYPDGTEEWFTLAGGIEAEAIAPGEALVFEVDGELIERPAVIQTLSDDQTQWVVAPLPDDVGVGEALEAGAVTHVRAGAVRRVIPASEIRVNAVTGSKLPR